MERQLESREEFLKEWTKLFREGKLIQNSSLIEEFLENKHHGLSHAVDVWDKARELISEIKEPLRVELIKIGCALHDAGRVFPEERIKDNHHRFSAEVCQRYLEEYFPKMEKRDQIDLLDLVYNHDYFNEALSGSRFTRPKSLEGEIVRAADKMSLEPRDEIKRYWAYGKEIGDLFNLYTPLEFRLSWTPSQARDPRTDQLCWFLLLFLLDARDFFHPVIADQYKKWSIKKREAVEEILKIAEEECPFQAPCLRQNYLDSLKMTIYAFKRAKGLEGW